MTSDELKIQVNDIEESVDVEFGDSDQIAYSIEP
jgi:hypothetical protein